MGTTKNEEAVTWAEKAEPKSVSLSRGRGVTGGESKSARNQQKRDNRAHRSESSIFSPGTAITGGVLDNLIDEYCDQVELKENEIQRLNDEVNRLKSRVQEFKTLRGELQKQFQEAS
jgi:chromosome segregation ATPase